MIIVKNHSADEEVRLQTEIQLMNSSEAYFAIEDRLHEGDHVEIPDPRGGLILKVAAEVEQHSMQASMASTFGGSSGYMKVK